MGGSASDNDNSPGRQQAMTGSPVGFSQTTAMGTDLTGKSKAEIDKQMAVDQALADKGYSKDYKGVSSGGKKGGVYSIDPATGEKVAVSSGAYNNDVAQAEANYDYKQAYAKAEADFQSKKAAGQYVSPEFSQIARGLTNNQFVINSPVEFINAKGQIGYGPNPDYGVPSSFSDIPGMWGNRIATIPGAASMSPGQLSAMVGTNNLNSSARASNLLGSGLARGDVYAQDGTFQDPYGSYLGTTADQTNRDIAALPGGNKNTGYLDQFQQGYNSTQDQGAFGKDGLFGTGFLGGEGERAQFAGKGDMRIDKAGNIGFKTTAQSLGDSMGELIAGQMLPGIGSAFNFNTQTNYGTNVPGYDNLQSTVSFGIPDALGGFLGTKAAPYVGQAVGQAVYDQTGNVQNAILSGIGSEALTGPAVASGTSAALKGVGVPANTVLSSDASISESGGGAYVDKDLDGSFRERLGGSGGDGDGNKIGPTSLMDNTIPGFQSPEILDTTGAYGTNNDLASVQSQFQQDNLQNYFANGSPTSLTGQSVSSPGNNPLFNINPAVTYRQSGGKNRNYGNAISNAVTPLVANQSFSDASRRKKFGDAMLGLFG